MKVTEIDDQKEVIYCITSAFSTEPASFWLGGKVNGETIANIELEILTIYVCGDPFHYRYYVGYSETGKRMFQYKAETVNVMFK